MSEEYNRHAYRRTIIENVQQMIMNRFMVSDSGPKETMLCEEVPRSISEVPQDALHSYLNELSIEESDERQILAHFRTIDMRTVQEKTETPNEPEAKKPGRKPKPKP